MVVSSRNRRAIATFTAAPFRSLASLGAPSLPGNWSCVPPRTLAQRRGSLLFAHFGLSGPVILDVSRAVSRGRIHHQWLPDEVWVDQDGLEPATQRALEALGHTFVSIPGWGDAEAVMVDPVTGLRSAASDPRNEGAPAGQE